MPTDIQTREIIPATPLGVATYANLKKQVSQVLIQGQRKLESLKVQIYWRTGKLILDYLKVHPEEGKHGRYLVERLSQDLDIDFSVLYRILRFSQVFPTLATWPMLTWSHYRELLGVEDAKIRQMLGRQTEQKGWNVRTLTAEIKRRKSRRSEIKKIEESALDVLPQPACDSVGLIRVKDLEDLGGLKRKVLDLGFYVYKQMPKAKLARFRDGAVLLTLDAKGKFKKASAGARPYDFLGRVEKVVDGDTLRVQVDLGFGEITRQYLRLYGIDTPERKTPAGRKAKTFVERFFTKDATITFKSTQRDLHGRYVSHVWRDGLYLNNVLLENHLAEVFK